MGHLVDNNRKKKNLVKAKEMSLSDQFTVGLVNFEERVSLNIINIAILVAINIIVSYFVYQYINAKQDKEHSHRDIQLMVERMVKEESYIMNRQIALDTKLESKKEIQAVKNDLKMEIMRLKNKLDGRLNREVASIEEKTVQGINKEFKELFPVLIQRINATTLTYSPSNYDILAYEQRLIESKMKQKMHRQKQALMNSLDLRKEEHRQLLEEFEIRSQTEIFAVQRKHEELRRQFRQQQYLVLK
jgi:hypothetical protein